jgi:hypothetical protein
VVITHDSIAVAGESHLKTAHVMLSGQAWVPARVRGDHMGNRAPTLRHRKNIGIANEAHMAM